jgi:hypothetical protein
MPLTNRLVAMTLTLVVVALFQIPAMARDMVTLSYKFTSAKRFVSGQRVIVRFSLTNTSSVPVTVLVYHTPLERIVGRILQIKCGGKQLPYLGPIVGRLAPTEEDYLKLLPGQSLDSEAIDLTALYKFPNGQTCTLDYEKSHLKVRSPDKGNGLTHLPDSAFRINGSEISFLVD